MLSSLSPRDTSLMRTELFGRRGVWLYWKGDYCILVLTRDGCNRISAVHPFSFGLQTWRVPLVILHSAGEPSSELFSIVRSLMPTERKGKLCNKIWVVYSHYINILQTDIIVKIAWIGSHLIENYKHLYVFVSWTYNIYTVKPVFKTTWEIGTTCELRAATSVPTVDLFNTQKWTWEIRPSEFRTVFHSRMGVPNSQVPLYWIYKCIGSVVKPNSQPWDQFFKSNLKVQLIKKKNNIPMWAIGDNAGALITPRITGNRGGIFGSLFAYMLHVLRDLKVFAETLLKFTLSKFAIIRRRDP